MECSAFLLLLSVMTVMCCDMSMDCNTCITAGCPFRVDFDGIGTCGSSSSPAALTVKKLSHCILYKRAGEKNDRQDLIISISCI
jgi:hypothetical protein